MKHKLPASTNGNESGGEKRTPKKQKNFIKIKSKIQSVYIMSDSEFLDIARHFLK